MIAPDRPALYPPHTGLKPDCPAETNEEVSVVKTMLTSYLRGVSAVTDSCPTWASASGHLTGVRVAAPFATEMQGTSVSAARFRSAVAFPALLPISDVVVTDDGSGLLAWRPPV
jgi:hypothetical protein